MTTKRFYSIGSEWVFYKVYTGRRTADSILTQIILPLTNKMLIDGIIDKWFFIRYADPRFHLRIRLHSPDSNNFHKIVSTLKKPLEKMIEKDLIWKIQLDTYQRELERYGNDSMELSESIFYYDSISIIQLIDVIEEYEDENLRWLFGLRSIDSLLNCFNYSLQDKLVLLKYLKTGFGLEFGMSRPLKKQLDLKYREARQKVDNFLILNKNKSEYSPILSIIQQKEHNMQPTIRELLSTKKYTYEELNGLLSSYIHMHMNRLFKSKNRLNEMVCYDFLYRYYNSLNARVKIRNRENSNK
ncbi:thiopeptide-type bacteriocin biosynthesis protein [Joostella atrarenae]|uniref:Thiopeptide-type bacteriocin biosynthesis protein n=1 Tax=Joostella atrarenae TaxID=679257 RepID=A0ABS9J7F0_9FLAO|nr:thiopeptide-type bacteriocin biosynthesis protein [Joostella atrarenae]MCF8716357.1 thiopeptide-type bacteriocin biosynthesis protein [Joostella atrarenae]